MSTPTAYLLTWTCYGTWLHGDERGSVDAEHNAPDSPFLLPNLQRQLTRSASLRSPPVRLDDARRQIVHATVVAHCDYRDWTLHALNVRTNHVHAVVSCDVPPERAMAELKAWTTRRLREAAHFGPRDDVWTEGGSRRHLWNSESLRHAIEYVMALQGDDLT
jgi:REP element-mobilizing transposase RayT